MSACNLCKQSERTLELYALMFEDGITPDQRVYMIVLKACSNLRNLQEGKKIHAEARAKDMPIDSCLGNSLVHMYGKCGDIMGAEGVFEAMQDRNLTSWTSMLAAYVDQGHAEKALQFYRYMCEIHRLSPNQHTFAVAIQACHDLYDQKKTNGTYVKCMCLDILHGLHADVRRCGFDCNTFVSTSLVRAYGKLGQIHEAENAFFLASEFDSILCNNMLLVYVEHGQAELGLQFYRHMLAQGIVPDQKTFVLAIQACGLLTETEEPITIESCSIKVKSSEFCHALHADAKKRGLPSNIFLHTTLIGVYAKCGAIEEAEDLFEQFNRPGVVPWTAMISAYVEQGREETALRAFRQMQKEGISGNLQTYVVAIQACASLGDKAGDPAGWELSLDIGMALHAEVRKKGLDSNIFVSTALLGMYAMCGDIWKAEIVFSTMPHHDLVAWNAMLNAYGEWAEEKAFHLFKIMLQEGIKPNQKTYVSLLQACAAFADREEVHYMPSLVCALYNDVQKRGLSSDLFIGNTLVHLFGTLGYLDEAEKVFHSLPYHQVISLNSMLTVYIQHGEAEKAIHLYKKMQNKLTLTDVSFVCVIQACGQTGDLELCKQVHFNIISAGYELNPSLASSLIRSYGSCGSMLDAQSVFDSLPDPDLVSWNVLLAGYAGEGSFTSCMSTLAGMQLAMHKPDATTMTSVLSACSHCGFVTEGISYFESLCNKFHIVPDVRHISTIIDLLGRAGYQEGLTGILGTLPMSSNFAVWLPLLGACNLHGNSELAKKVFNHSANMDFEDATAFIIMSNIYADLHFEDDIG
ncbi:hypothetical protein KP509_10G031100 [Ceratopteris richardii]|nr:hypothetical protein KP509_10G031100 [Ceratopteris richardii]